jgi:uncharacterized protein (TIGR01777 family)
MNVSIAGITGFIGTYLKEYLKDLGFEVTQILREDFKNHRNLREKLLKSDVVINLSGYSVFGLWTKKRKRKIYESRLLTTGKIVEEINKSEREIVFINASAVGIYNSENIHTEKSTKYAENYLANVVIDWEKEVRKINNSKIRWIILRMGIVIDKRGGYFGKQLFLVKRGIFIALGRKSEYLPVISLNELLNIFLFLIQNKNICGIVNAVAPFMIRVNEFYGYLIRNKQAFFYLKIPDICIRIFLGDASVLFIEGQRVVPEKLLMNNYPFMERSLDDLLKAVFQG